MKKIIGLLSSAILIILIACNSAGNEKKTVHKIPATDSMQVAKPVKKFAGIQFASKYDTTCGMPLSAGLEDTVLLYGKVYGFCAAGCKDEFISILKKEHKR